jgi:hypothetical protein
MKTESRSKERRWATPQPCGVFRYCSWAPSPRFRSRAFGHASHGAVGDSGQDARTCQLSLVASAVRGLSDAPPKVGFAMDSPLEGDGFELPVPRVLEPSRFICLLDTVFAFCRRYQRRIRERSHLPPTERIGWSRNRCRLHTIQAQTRKCARMKLSPAAEGIGNREHDELGDRDALH